MRRRVLRGSCGAICAALLLLAGLADARAASDAAKPKPAYRVSGVAVNSRNGAPIPFCRVRLSPMEAGNAIPEGRRSRFDGRPPDGRSDNFRGRRGDGGAISGMDGAVLADAHGRFTLEAPKAGTWRLTGIARGFRLQGYEQHDGFSSGVVLSDTAPAASVTFRLAPDAVLSGVVFDEAGEPVAGARVQAENASDTGGAENRPAGAAQTNDRGHYELAGLAPGAYRLRVEARPWYASGGGAPVLGRSFTGLVPLVPAQTTTGAASPDPSLDLVYPTTWFPGAESAAQADVLTLAGGEDRQADFHLLPQPAAQLTVARPTPTGVGGIASPSQDVHGWLGPLVSQSGAASPLVTGTMSVTADAWEVGGLGPGTYEVRIPTADDSSPDVRQFTVTRGGAVDLSVSVPLVPVTLRFEGAPGERPQVSLTNVESGAHYSTGGRRDFGGLGDVLPGRRDAGEPRLSVPAGRYRVSAVTVGDAYLDGVSAGGVEVDPGGVVQISGEAAALTLRLAAGKASLSGMAHRGETPAAGAMVLVVPALADAADLADRITRTETNSDGSFTLASLTPGPYIVVVLESGWLVNWRDQSTLAGYLMRGVPVDLKPASKPKLDVTAALP